MKRLTEEEQREWARCLREEAGRRQDEGSVYLRGLADRLEQLAEEGVLWPHPEQP